MKRASACISIFRCSKKLIIEKVPHSHPPLGRFAPSPRTPICPIITLPPPPPPIMKTKSTPMIIAEEQAGFRIGHSTAEQIINLRILGEKDHQHQQDLYQVFVDFKKAFDKVWHAALWATMKLYNIIANLINTIKNLYEKATSGSLF